MHLLLGILAGISTVATPADDGWNADWPVRQRVYFDARAIGMDLVDLPLRVILPPEAAQGLRAVAADGTTLPLEVARADERGVEAYVRVPRIVVNQPGQHIDLYYGKAAPAEPGKVWDDDYRVVLHFNGNLANALGNDDAVSVEGPVEVTPEGAIFASDSAFLRIDPARLEGVGEGLTITVRFKTEGGPDMQTLVSGLREDPRDWFNFGLKRPDVVHTNAVSNSQIAPELNVAAMRPGEWHSAVIRYNAREHTRMLCVDGLALQRDSALPGPLRVQELRIGRGLLHFEPWQFHGVIDEVRIAAAARPIERILAEAGSLVDANAFYTVGPPQKRGEPMPPPGAFALIDPADGLKWRKREDVLLRWFASPGAESYAVRVYADRAATRLLAEHEVLNSPGFVLSRISGAQEAYWTVVARSPQGETPASEIRGISFYDWSETGSQPPRMTAQPALTPIEGLEIQLQGYLKDRVDRVVKNWFLIVPESSPAILQVFRDRDKRPVRDPLVPWAGEFAGKFLTAGQLNWRLTRDPALKDALDAFARDLIACQAENGYLGPFPPEARLTGNNWDVWGHYHCMLGLLLHYEDTGYEPALDACRKTGDLLFETFGPGGPSLTCDGSQGQMNMAVCHGLLMLHEKTGVQRYRDLAEYIVHDAWNEPGAGQYLKSALEGKEVWEFPAHRWEALHDHQALVELYWLTGNEDYRRAFEHIWRSCAKGDRHNTGGFTSGEGCTGSPYNLGAIETCCTVAWTALSVDMLRLTGDPRVADEIEWSTLNSALAALPHSGRACAYNVPMDGTRTFGVELPWQAPKAGPDLNCCSVNAPRPLGMIGQWALMRAPDGIALNFYGPCTLTAPLPSGNRVSLAQETHYPADGRIRLAVSPERPERFNLRLRIPRWSKNTAVRVNGEMQPAPEPGSYLELNREWKQGDTVEIDLDFSLRFWEGQQEVGGKASVFRGPILFAYDARFNDINPDEFPTLQLSSVQVKNAPSPEGPIAPWILATLTAGDQSITVCDLASAGQTGNHYRTWFPAEPSGAPAPDPAWPFE